MARTNAGRGGMGASSARATPGTWRFRRSWKLGRGFSLQPCGRGRENRPPLPARKAAGAAQEGGGTVVDRTRDVYPLAYAGNRMGRSIHCCLRRPLREVKAASIARPLPVEAGWRGGSPSLDAPRRIADQARTIKRSNAPRKVPICAHTRSSRLRRMGPRSQSGFISFRPFAGSSRTLSERS
jgi:hypothetical protein